MNTRDIQWTQLLHEAVTLPGAILDAYSAFHAYSLGNQMPAIYQCRLRGIAIGPVDTYRGWQAKGRQVRKGEKALLLCMPYKARRTEERNGEEVKVDFLRGFDWKANWFTLAQTDPIEGQEPTFTEVPPATWDKAAALAALDISEVPFEHPNGNAQGFARGREIAVSPLAKLPHKTLFHELAHVMLGHTLKGELSDSETLPKSLIEAEAEGVAYLICSTLELPGIEYSRGYIQHWLDGAEIPEASARRIFSAANTILKSGQVAA